MRRRKKNTASISTSVRGVIVLKILLAISVGVIAVFANVKAETSLPPQKEEMASQTPVVSSLDKSLSAPNTLEEIEEQKRVLDSARRALELRFHSLSNSAADGAYDPANDKKVDQAAITRLMSIYENMSPREAAAVFDVMDPHVLVALSARMKTRKLSAIMAQMSRERVNMISQYLSGVRKFHKNASMNIPEINDRLLHDSRHKAKSETAPLLPSRQ